MYMFSPEIIEKTHFVSLSLVQSTPELKNDTLTKQMSILYLKGLSFKVCLKLSVSVPADFFILANSEYLDEMRLMRHFI